MHLDKIPIGDLISILAGLTGFVAAWMNNRQRLPSWARKWLNKVGAENIRQFVERAASLAELTSDQRRQQAVVYMQQFSIKKLGFPVPASIANLLVEHIYQQWKRARR